MRLSIDLMLSEPVSANLAALLLRINTAPTTSAFCAELEQVQFDDYELDDVSRLEFAVAF